MDAAVVGKPAQDWLLFHQSNKRANAVLPPKDLQGLGYKSSLIYKLGLPSRHSE